MFVQVEILDIGNLAAGPILTLVGEEVRRIRNPTSHQLPDELT